LLLFSARKVWIHLWNFLVVHMIQNPNRQCENLLRIIDNLGFWKTIPEDYKGNWHWFLKPRHLLLSSSWTNAYVSSTTKNILRKGLHSSSSIHTAWQPGCMPCFQPRGSWPNGNRDNGQSVKKTISTHSPVQFKVLWTKSRDKRIVSMPLDL
jgi:hypothetical protein